jgi:hypothetical protein
MSSLNLSREYYTPEEALKIINEADINITLGDLYHFGEIGKLKFSLHLGSRPAIAIKRYNETNEAYFIGHCKLNGIIHAFTKEVCGILANKYYTITHLYSNNYDRNTFVGDWYSTPPKDLAEAVPDYLKLWKPEDYSDELIIDGFYLKPDYSLQIRTENNFKYIPFHILTPDLTKEFIKSGIGTASAHSKNQTFTKDHLRVTNENLNEFINIFKSTTNAEKNTHINSTNEIEMLNTDEEQDNNESVKDRNSRLLHDAVNIALANDRLELPDIHHKLINQEIHRSKVGEATLKHKVKKSFIIKEINTILNYAANLLMNDTNLNIDQITKAITSHKNWESWVCNNSLNKFITLDRIKNQILKIRKLKKLSS